MTKKSPTITVSIIGRNEAHNLPRLLSSLQGFADEIIYVDTGSKDKSEELAREAGATILNFKWIDDFAAARNFGIEHATKDHIFILDCDEELPPGEGEKIRDYLKDNPEVDVLQVIDRDMSRESYHPSVRIWRNGLGIKYIYPVHEQVHVPDELNVVVRFTEFKIWHHGYHDSVLKDKYKERKDREVIVEANRKDPGNEHFAYYAAQNAQIDGDSERAMEIIQKLIEVNGEIGQARTYRLVASVLASRKRYQEALQYLDEGSRKFPDYADLDYVRGNIYLETGRPKEAVACYEKCLTVPMMLNYTHWGGVTTYLPLRGLAMCLFSLGKIDEAIEKLTESVRYSGANKVSAKMLEDLFVKMFGEAEGHQRFQAHLAARGITLDAE